VLKLLRDMVLAVAALLALACAAVAAVIAIASAQAQREAERKIWLALSSHYPGDSVSVNDRVDYDYLGYGNQSCFDVTVRSPKTGSTRRDIVMIDGDDDGGTWVFGRTYGRMRDCEDGFDRG